MSLELPDHLVEKVISFGESSYGATIVTLILMDGRHIEKVAIAWGRWIVKVGTRAIAGAGELDFRVADIVDVASEGRT